MNDAAQQVSSRSRLGAIGVPRASAFPDALRHTARVARLRRVIVWASGSIVALVLLGLAIHAFDFLPADLRFARIALEGTRITIETPKLVGYRPDGRPYEIRAKLGVQDMTAPDVFELEGLEVRFENSADNSVMLSARQGVYNAKREHANLAGEVRIHDDKNFDLRLKSAVVDFKASVMKSERPATLTINSGEVTANSVEFAQKERRATFLGDVRSVFRSVSLGERDDAAPADAALRRE